MRPTILSPDYVHIPATAVARARMSASHRRRLGIPDGYCRIYGEVVPLEHAEPLRSYAYDMARRHGYDAARGFVLSAMRSNSELDRPYPARTVFYGPYLPPREFARLRLLRRFARGFHVFVRRISRTYKANRSGGTGTGRPRTDWKLVEALLADGATLEEVRVLFGASEVAFRHKAIALGLAHPKRRSPSRGR